MYIYIHVHIYAYIHDICLYIHRKIQLHLERHLYLEKESVPNHLRAFAARERPSACRSGGRTVEELTRWIHGTHPSTLGQKRAANERPYTYHVLTHEAALQPKIQLQLELHLYLERESVPKNLRAFAANDCPPSAGDRDYLSAVERIYVNIYTYVHSCIYGSPKR